MTKILTTAAFLALFTCAAWAQNSPSTTSPQNNENSGPKSDELNQAAQTVQDLTSSTQIPHQLLTQARSEEHTSELQSPCNLVCRLLLEKKKQRNASTL